MSNADVLHDPGRLAAIEEHELIVYPKGAGDEAWAVEYCAPNGDGVLNRKFLAATARQAIDKFIAWQKENHDD